MHGNNSVLAEVVSPLLLILTIGMDMNKETLFFSFVILFVKPSAINCNVRLTQDYYGN